MYFQSWSEFWSMGGYGLFVWLSFGLTYLLLAGLVAYSHMQHKAFMRQFAARLAREKRIKQFQEQSE